MLQEVCSEADLTRISERLTEWEFVYKDLGVTESEANEIKNYDYGQQPLLVLKIWKRRRGFQATFKALIDVFSKQPRYTTMVGVICDLAAVSLTGK